MGAGELWRSAGMTAPAHTLCSWGREATVGLLGVISPNSGKSASFISNVLLHVTADLAFSAGFGEGLVPLWPESRNNSSTYGLIRKLLLLKGFLKGISTSVCWSPADSFVLRGRLSSVVLQYLKKMIRLSNVKYYIESNNPNGHTRIRPFQFACLNHRLGHCGSWDQRSCWCESCCCWRASLVPRHADCLLTAVFSWTSPRVMTGMSCFYMELCVKIKTDKR